MCVNKIYCSQKHFSSVTYASVFLYTTADENCSLLCLWIVLVARNICSCKQRCAEYKGN